jgi:hypothetical protein
MRRNKSQQKANRKIEKTRRQRSDTGTKKPLGDDDALQQLSQFVIFVVKESTYRRRRLTMR